MYSVYDIADSNVFLSSSALCLRLLICNSCVCSYEIPEEVEQDYESQYNAFSTSRTSQVSYSYAASTLLAMDHFNNRDASVVPELAGLDGRCSIYFPDPTLENSRADGAVSVRTLWDSTIANEASRPCAVVAPLLEDANYDLQPALSALDIPMVVHHIESDLLASEDAPETATMSLSAMGRAEAMLTYLQGRAFLADWYPALEQDIALAETVERIGGRFNLDVSLYMQKSPPMNVTEEEFTRQNLLYMKETGITTIMLSLKDPSYVPEFAQMLDNLDMLLDDFIYILPPTLVPVDSVGKLYGEHKPGSPVDKLLSGALVFDRVDGFEMNSEDPFLAAWKKQSEQQVSRLNELVPLTWLNAAPDYFQTALPAKGASFIYDAIMTIGFGACKQQKHDRANLNNTSAGGSPNDQPEGPPTDFEAPEGFSVVETDESNEEETPVDTGVEVKNTKKGGWFGRLFGGFLRNRRLQSIAKPINGTLMGSMASSSFQGASGSVSFGNEFEKGRNQEGITIGAYNIRPTDVNSENDKRSYQAVMTSTWTKESGWKDVPDTAFVYRDGSTTAPDVLRRVFDSNYITQAVRVIGLTLMSIALLIAFLSIVLLGWLRKDPIVQRAQPFFMQILCAGSIIMSAAIFTLSFDEDAGWSEEQLSLACTMTPWFFFTGHVLMFCALFTKLWRVDRVLQFRRQAVTITSALWPLLAFLGITITILVVHTAIDPWIWQREVIQEAPVETYGQCTSEYQWLWFGPLAGLIFVSEILTMFFAWKTADIPEDFRDSEAVMYACFAQIQAWAVGVPMLAVLGTSSADATYFGRIFLVWIFSVSSVVVVVGPKLFKAIKIRRNPQLGRTGARVSVTGLYNAGTGTTGGSTSFGCHSVSKLTDSTPPSRWLENSQASVPESTGPPSRWFMDSNSQASVPESTGPPARWFMDSQASSNSLAATKSQAETIGRESTASDVEQVPESAPPSRRPLSRNLSRGNNLIQMSMRGGFDINSKALQDIEEADRIDEEADLLEIDLEGGSDSTMT